MIYASYAYVGSPSVSSFLPAWVQYLLKVKQQTYLPSIALIQQKNIMEVLYKHSPAEKFSLLWLPLGLSQDLEDGLDDDKVNHMLSASINQLSDNLMWMHQYVLIRSDVVMADLDIPSYGEVAVDILVASALGIPVIGVCSKVFQAPHLLNRLECIIHPSKVREFLKTLPGYIPEDVPEAEPKDEQQEAAEGIPDG